MSLDADTSAEVFEVIMDGNDVVVAEEEHSPSQSNEDFLESPDTELTDDDSTVEADLTWRSDPKKSLADWTVQIVVKGSSSVTSYHVHKSVLAVGPRRSNYFASTFASAQNNGRKSSRGRGRSQTPPPSPYDNIHPCDFLQDTLSLPASQLVDYTDHRSSTTRLEVELLAAEAFPVLLDYMYSSIGELAINTENATALFALSAQLGIKTLRRKSKDFWIKDLCMENLTTYYAHARIFKDNKMLTYAEEYCADHIFEVKETLVVEILTAVDPHFFLRVVTSSVMQGDEQAALRLSLLIAVYGNIHKNELSPSLFLRLTAAGHLPTVEVKAATVLLELEDDICQTSDRMTSLKERAIAVISRNWEDACFGQAPVDKKDPDLTDGKAVLLPRVKGQALEVFVKKTLAQARRDRLTSAQELIDLRSFKAEHKEQADREENLVKDLEAAKAEVAQLKSDAEQSAKAQKAEVEHLRQTKLKLTAEVNELRKAMALDEDMKKLKRVASGGAASLLRSKDNQ